MEIRFQCSLNGKKELTFGNYHHEIKEGAFSITPMTMDNGILNSTVIFTKDNNEKEIGTIQICQQVFAIDSIVHKKICVSLRIFENILDTNNLLNQNSVQFEQFKFKLMKSFMKLRGNKFFSRISVYEDFQSKLISENLFSLIYDLENKFREVLDRVLTIEIGPTWTESLDSPYSPKEKKNFVKGYCRVQFY